MGPPTAKAAVPNDRRPQSSSTGDRRVPSVQIDVPVSNQYPTSQVSTTISPPAQTRTRIDVSIPDQQHSPQRQSQYEQRRQQQPQQRQTQYEQQQQQQQRQYEQHQYQQTSNNEYSTAPGVLNIPPSQTQSSSSNADQHSQEPTFSRSDAHASREQTNLDNQGEDCVDMGRLSRVNVNVNVEQEVCESTPGLMQSFIVDRMEHDGYTVPPALARSKKNESEVACVLRRMGDDISRNMQLNHLIGAIKVTPDTAYKTFASVACQIFTDGTINWGRIVMLFYFGYKLALQQLNQLPLIDTIIGWVTRFVTERLSTWISARGGWRAIREYYGSSTGQMVGVFLAGLLVSSIFWYWKESK